MTFKWYLWGFCALASCARSPVPPPAPEGCIDELKKRGVSFQVGLDPQTQYPVESAGIHCRIEAPVRLSPVLHGITFRFIGEAKEMVASCALALKLDEMAALAAHEGIQEIEHLGTFACRPVRGRKAPSMHSYALGFDLAAVKDRSGARYSVLEDWNRGDQSNGLERGSWFGAAGGNFGDQFSG